VQALGIPRLPTSLEFHFTGWFVPRDRGMSGELEQGSCKLFNSFSLHIPIRSTDRPVLRCIFTGDGTVLSRCCWVHARTGVSHVNSSPKSIIKSSFYYWSHLESRFRLEVGMQKVEGKSIIFLIVGKFLKKRDTRIPFCCSTYMQISTWRTHLFR
jgi:hypothetical protein